MSETGRPCLYTDPLLFEAKVEQYFDQLARDGLDSIPTVAELAYFLGFSDRLATTRKSPNFPTP